jgi:uncharacterized protein YndB with AHSA1/START domain
MLAGKGSDVLTQDRTTLEVIGDREVVITRRFDAPARIVFEAWTKPELVKRWWAPKSRRVVMASCEADVRTGGRYRYVMARDGAEIPFSGEYREVTPHSRLVYTSIFEPMKAMGEAVVTVTFEEKDGRTLLTTHEVYASKQARDGALASGMESGMRETMNQLEELVASLG